MQHIRPENALRESSTPPLDEALFEDAFDNAPQAMAVLAIDGRLVRANRSLCRMLGFTRAELQALGCVNIIHGDDFPTESLQRQRLAAADIGRYELVLRCLRKDGDPLWIRLAVSAVGRGTGEKSYLVAAVEPVPSPIARVNRSTEDAWVAHFGDAALAAVHEIGNSLTPLMVNTEMILEQARQKELRDSAQAIFKAARRIAFSLRRLRGVDDGLSVAYVGEHRMLDLRLIAPPEAGDSGPVASA